MSKVFKATNITIDEDKRVTINASPACSVETCIEADPQTAVHTEPEESPERILESARQEAKRIAERAAKQAEDTINNAKKAAESEARDITDAAHKEGYSKGYAEGKSKADSLIKQAEGIKEDAYALKEELMLEAEPQMVDLMVELLEKLLDGEVQINPQVISILVKQGLKQATMTGDILVHVSKEDFNDVMAAREDILSSFETMAKVDFMEDAALRKSDCIIETALGSIDCGLKSQFRELRKNIYYLLSIR